MWCVLSEMGELLEAFPPDKKGWDAAVAWAVREGGELDVVFLAHVKPGWRNVSG